MGKRNMKKFVMAITTAIAVTGTALFNVLPVFAEPDEESRGSIVVDEGEILLDTADISILKKELDSLEAELPDASKQSYYGTARKSRLNSKGIIDYADKTVIIDSSDFAYLADEIDMLESSYKANSVSALNAIGTFFLADGSIIHPEEGEEISTAESVCLPFDTIISGIMQSQSVDHLAGQGITASITDNLSKNTAAWVNGKLIIGNGADNDAFYRQGFLDGQLSIYDKVNISYIYHEHKGSPYVTGGCISAWHEHTSDCAYHTGSVCDASVSEVAHAVNYNNNGELCCRYACSIGHTFIVHHDHQGGCIHADIIYDCGDSPMNQWKYVCDKTTSTIESATIVFND